MATKKKGKKPALPSRPRSRRILVVDDHPIMRQGLILLLENEPDLEVCGEAPTAETALDQVLQLKPDLVLADLTMPGKSGLELIKDLHVLQPGLPVLVVSMHDESVYAERVLRAGGRGYIMKDKGGARLVEAIRRVVDGQIYVSETMSARILELYSGGKGEGPRSSVDRLTDREFEVFRLIGEGRGTREIADQLHLSVKTVEVHRGNIKEKLDVRKGPELIRHAVRWVEAQNPA